jgi:hypothetical protein
LCPIIACLIFLCVVCNNYCSASPRGCNWSVTEVLNHFKLFLYLYSMNYVKYLPKGVSCMQICCTSRQLCNQLCNCNNVNMNNLTILILFMRPFRSLSIIESNVSIVLYKPLRALSQLLAAVLVAFNQKHIPTHTHTHTHTHTCISCDRTSQYSFVVEIDV